MCLFFKTVYLIGSILKALALFLHRNRQKRNRYSNRFCGEIYKISEVGWKKSKAMESYIGDIAELIVYLVSMDMKFQG